MRRELGGRNLVNVDTSTAELISLVLETDSRFLRDHNLLDYSCYLVVESKHHDPIKHQRRINRNKFISSDGMEAYHIGIIDYLQRWNNTKKTERCFKQAF